MTYKNKFPIKFLFLLYFLFPFPFTFIFKKFVNLIEILFLLISFLVTMPCIVHFDDVTFLLAQCFKLYCNCSSCGYYNGARAAHN